MTPSPAEDFQTLYAVNVGGGLPYGTSPAGPCLESAPATRRRVMTSSIAGVTGIGSSVPTRLEGRADHHYLRSRAPWPAISGSMRSSRGVHRYALVRQGTRRGRRRPDPRQLLSIHAADAPRRPMHRRRHGFSGLPRLRHFTCEYPCSSTPARTSSTPPFSPVGAVRGLLFTRLCPMTPMVGPKEWLLASQTPQFLSPSATGRQEGAARLSDDLGANHFLARSLGSSCPDKVCREQGS